MKKLYFLNEEEKERILGLHESATRKQYISEDMDNRMCEGCEKSDMYETELDEVDAGAVATGFLLGGVGGAALAYVNSSSGSYTGVKKIFDACRQSGMGKSTMNGGTMDSIASKIRTAIDGWTTDEDAIKSALSQIKTLPDLCEVSRRYSENYPGSTLLDDLDGDIDSDSEWNQYVYLPLLAAKRKSEEIGKKSGGGSSGGSGTGGGSWWDNAKQGIYKVTSDKLWANYPCIPQNPQAKRGQMSNGSTVFTIGQEVFYNNGRKKKADGTMVNYVCPSSGGGNVAPKTTTPAKTTTGTPKTALSQSNVKQVQKLVGVAETGVFDTATAKAVRTKLGA
jgi:hypothetical protein